MVNLTNSNKTLSDKTALALAKYEDVARAIALMNTQLLNNSNALKAEKPPVHVIVEVRHSGTIQAIGDAAKDVVKKIMQGVETAMPGAGRSTGAERPLYAVP